MLLVVHHVWMQNQLHTYYTCRSYVHVPCKAPPLEFETYDERQALYAKMKRHVIIIYAWCEEAIYMMVS